MILTIITVIASVVGVILLGKNEYEEGVFFGLGFILTLGGGLIAFIMAICIICAHVGVNAQIEENRIEYESLCERYEIVTSEYEDVSKSDVIKDISEWNKKVYGYKHWAYNPWTNWFYSKRVADDMKMIERKCLLNDCNCNSPDPAPCCLDCSERDVCPDRCPKSDTIYCIGVIDDCKGIPQTNNED